MNAPLPTQPRATQLSHGDGCDFQIAPGVLSETLLSTHAMSMSKQLLVGIETVGDAAVNPLNEDQALIATTHFFMPIADDPHVVGRTAATSAFRGMYAMVGTPSMALARVVDLAAQGMGADASGRNCAACAHAGHVG